MGYLSFQTLKDSSGRATRQWYQPDQLKEMGSRQAWLKIKGIDDSAA